MRTRDKTLRTGSLLAYFDPSNRDKNRSFLFLVRGAADIEPLTDIEKVCRNHIQERGLSGFEWHAVSDQGQLTSVDPRLDASRISRLEVREFAGLGQKELENLLPPALDRLARGDQELFPSAGGAVGAPAEGIQFLDRESDVRTLATSLRQGMDILVQAPRRSGKTSLLRHLETVLKAGYSPVFMDLERDQSPIDLTARISSLATGDSFRSAQRRAAHEGWKHLLTLALRSLVEKGGKPLVLLLDELVFFLQNLRPAVRDEIEHRREVLGFLSAFSDSLRSIGARIVVAGSLNLPEYIRDSVGAEDAEIPSPFRQLVQYNLPPLAGESLQIELRRVLMGTGLVVEPADVEWLAENVDLAVPHPALKFLDQLAYKVRATGQLGSEQLNEEFMKFLEHTDAFKDFEEHLRRKGVQLPGARDAASDALDLIAQAPEDGVPVDQLKSLLEKGVPRRGDEVFAWLTATFPVRQEGSQVFFVSRMFRRWWRGQLAELREQR